MASICFLLTLLGYLSFVAGSLVPQEGHPNITHSLNVSTCPGYTLHSLLETDTGISAWLGVAGPACNAFGRDVVNLTVEVTYEISTRLHVNIFDTANAQFTIPESVVPLESGSTAINKNNSDLQFNFEVSPFAFWITRRSAGSDNHTESQPLFDTRISSLPATPISPVIPLDNSTALDGFPLVFEDQYLQLTSALPLNANIYGLGEIIASSGFRRDVGANGGNGTIQTMWARDITDPIDQNIYGVHPVYMEHRFDEATQKSQTHGVLLFSASGSDILLLTPPSFNTSLIQYRMITGTLDLYFFSGPTPQTVIEQYGQLIGFPTWQPYFGFGFHLCRWGYSNVSETKEQVTKMREAGIPLEVMWNDIDLYHAVRDFTTDPVSFPASEMKAFIDELHANNQHYIPIVDAAVAKQINSSDIYDPYTRGVELQTFMKNPDDSEYIGQVWPGYTVFPDWFSKNAETWWTEALKNWSQSAIDFDGIWLDMNEVSSFCTGSCGTGADLSNTTIPGLFLPGTPESPVVDYPEGYDSSKWGPSGNVSINGTLTFGSDTPIPPMLLKRGLGAGKQSGISVNDPPYAIHNGNGPLSVHTLATNATHANGLIELDTHNLHGLMETKATHQALLSIHPSKRPFIISRSTTLSSGRYAGHWLGDNFNTCGFIGNTDEELCNRWMQLSAFMPFFRNHNQRGALSQEPYRWDSVAEASRKAIGVRYQLLPYWYTLFANASMMGTPPIRALFYEFPDEPELFSVDRQFLIGREILITPVLTPNVSTVNGIFPGRGTVVWRDWYTHNVVNTTNDGSTTSLPAPLGHINVHIRDGSVLLLHDKPVYTVTETRAGPFALLVCLSNDGSAFGTAYIDDGETVPPTPNTTLTFEASKGQKLELSPKGSFRISQTLETLIILGVPREPAQILLNGQRVHSNSWKYIAAQEKVVLTGMNVNLNILTRISWS
ncbi:glycosyl hydrolase 31 family protein [Abortiporus biennis]